MKLRFFYEPFAWLQKLNAPLVTRTGTKFVVNSCTCYLSSCCVRYQNLPTRSSVMKIPRMQPPYFLDSIRNYAKGKDKKKEKGKQNIQINEAELAELIPLEKLKTQLQRAVDNLKDEYVMNYSLRTSNGSLERIIVHLDGEQKSLGELAKVVRPDMRTIVLRVSAFPQALPAIVHALRTSGMNLNPRQDGTTIFVPVPRVTAEHRKELAGGARTQYLRCRQAVKAAALSQAKAVREKQGLPQDTVYRVQEQIAALADNYVGAAEKLLEAKLEELLPSRKL